MVMCHGRRHGMVSSVSSYADATRTIPAGEFKAKCLKLMDEVSETGVPIVITKRGKPVSRLVPARLGSTNRPRRALRRLSRWMMDAGPAGLVGAGVVGVVGEPGELVGLAG